MVYIQNTYISYQMLGLLAIALAEKLEGYYKSFDLTRPT
jgi:hypothetical protein